MAPRCRLVALPGGGKEKTAVPSTRACPRFVRACVLVGSLSGFLLGAVVVSGDQRMRELLLSAHELKPVRLELVACRVARVQRLPLCNERAEGVP